MSKACQPTGICLLRQSTSGPLLVVALGRNVYRAMEPGAVPFVMAQDAPVTPARAQEAVEGQPVQPFVVLMDVVW